MEELKRRLSTYDARYVGLLDITLPILQSGRGIDLERVDAKLNRRNGGFE